MMSTILNVLLSIVSIVSAFLLIGIILIQQSKSGGGLGAVSGGMTESMFGASAGNVLTKATTWIAAIFLVSTLFLATVIGRLRDDTSAAELIPQAATIETTSAPAAAVFAQRGIGMRAYPAFIRSSKNIYAADKQPVKTPKTK